MGGGFFATCPEGYGVSYMIYGDDLSKLLYCSKSFYNTRSLKETLKADAWCHNRHYTFKKPPCTLP